MSKYFATVSKLSRYSAAVWSVPASLALLFGVPAGRVAQSLGVTAVGTFAFAGIKREIEEEEDAYEAMKAKYSYLKPAQYTVHHIHVREEDLQANVQK